MTAAVDRRPARVARALAGALYAGVLLLSGCGVPDPGGAPETGQQGPDPALGGVQPASAARADELMDTAVENTDALMVELGG